MVIILIVILTVWTSLFPVKKSNVYILEKVSHIFFCWRLWLLYLLLWYIQNFSCYFLDTSSTWSFITKIEFKSHYCNKRKNLGKHSHEECPYQYLLFSFGHIFHWQNIIDDKKVRILVLVLTKWRKSTDAWQMAVQIWILKGPKDQWAQKQALSQADVVFIVCTWYQALLS